MMTAVRSQMPWSYTFVLALCLAAGLLGTHRPLHAADLGAPTAAEWRPIANLISTDPRAALSALEIFLKDRHWPDGHIVLAECYRRAGDLAKCYERAKHALALLQAESQAETNSNNESLQIAAGCLAMHAANRLGRVSNSVKIYQQIDQLSDPSGKVLFHIAESALRSDKLDLALKYIKAGSERAKRYLAVVPDQLLALHGHILVQQALSQSDDERAASLRQAVDLLSMVISEDPAVQAQLGLAYQQLAHLYPEQTRDYRVKAERALLVASRANPEEINLRLALSDVQLHLDQVDRAWSGFQGVKRRVSDDEQTAIGEAAATLALAQTSPNRRQSLAAEALAILADLPTAAQAAQANNQAAAYASLTGADQPAQLAMANLAQSPAVSDRNRGLLAIQLMQAQAVEPAGTRWSTLAAHHLATDADINLQDDPSSWPTTIPDEQIELWYALGTALAAEAEATTASADISKGYSIQALTALRLAGNQRQFDARRAYLQFALSRDAATAYDAGWQALSWNWLNTHAYIAIIANYGASGYWAQPLHLAIWAVLIILPLALLLRSRKQKRLLAVGDQFADATIRPSTQAQHRNSALVKRSSSDNRPGTGSHRTGSNAATGRRNMPQPSNDTVGKAATRSYAPNSLRNHTSAGSKPRTDPHRRQ